jgi:hypothetical protein
MPPSNIQLENNEILINLLTTYVIPITLTFLAIIVSSLICNTYTKNENEDEDEDEDEKWFTDFLFPLYAQNTLSNSG